MFLQLRVEDLFSGIQWWNLIADLKEDLTKHPVMPHHLPLILPPVLPIRPDSDPCLVSNKVTITHAPSDRQADRGDGDWRRGLVSVPDDETLSPSPPQLWTPLSLNDHVSRLSSDKRAGFMEWSRGPDEDALAIVYSGRGEGGQAEREKDINYTDWIFCLLCFLSER